MGLVVEKKQKVLILLGVMFVMFLSSMDMTVVSTAMPTIIRELNGMEYYSWIFTVYTLASTMVIPVFGKLSDIYGRKIFFILGVTVFLLGSALSGMSWGVIELIIFRGIQGIGAGMIMGVSFAVISDLFTPRQRGKYMGILMSLSALATIIGPSLGGYISDNWSWRWCFYINLPIGIIAIILLHTAMPAVKRKVNDSKIDYIGAILTATTFTPLLLALSWGGNKYEWGSGVILGLLGWSVLSFIALLLVEFKVKDPVIPVQHFRKSVFTIGSIANFMNAFVMFGVLMYMPLYMQNVLGITATNSGAITTPLMLSMFVSAMLTGQLISRTGFYKIFLVTGSVISAIALYLFTTMDINTLERTVTLYMILFGFGNGLIMPSLNISVQNIFEKKEMGSATASLQFFKNLGSSVGVAVLGAVLANSLSAGSVSQHAQMVNLSHAIHSVFVVSLGVSLVSLVVMLFMKALKLRESYDEEVEEKPRGERVMI